MDNREPLKDSIGLSVDKIIDLIRIHRNAIITGFLIDENLLDYFKNQYDLKLSPRKKEFLKKDLKHLLISPVDLVHYSGLIKEMHESAKSSLDAKSEEFIYLELQIIFKKYCY